VRGNSSAVTERSDNRGLSGYPDLPTQRDSRRTNRPKPSGRVRNGYIDHLEITPTDRVLSNRLARLGAARLAQPGGSHHVWFPKVELVRREFSRHRIPGGPIRCAADRQHAVAAHGSTGRFGVNPERCPTARPCYSTTSGVAQRAATGIRSPTASRPALTAGHSATIQLPYRPEDADEGFAPGAAFISNNRPGGHR